MPNHIPCVLTVEGRNEDVDAFINFARGPMPRFAPSNYERGEMIRKNQDPDNPPVVVSDFECNQFVPVPAEVLEAGFDKAGYEWCRYNWGTKWGTYDTMLAKCCGDGSGYAAYAFKCAWNPCIPVIDAAAARFPWLRLHLRYTQVYDDTRCEQTWEATQRRYRDDYDNVVTEPIVQEASQ